MLVELRRELYEVRRHIRAGEPRVFDPREQRVQRVPELVEHRLDVLEAQQGRLAGGRLREVGDVENDRPGAQ